MKQTIIALLLASTSAIRITEGPKCEYKARTSPVPAQFTGREDDTFMRSIIEKYSDEEFCDGKATGKFAVSKSSASALATEVVGTHMPNAPAEYLNDNFPKAWDRADVNRTGHVDAARAATMIREVVANPVVGLGLQMQKPKQSLAASKGDPVVEYKARESPVPEHFTGREDDTFMRSIIGTYSKEKFVDGKPTGEFFMDKKGFEAISNEVVNTHVKPDSVPDYLKETAKQDESKAGVQPAVGRMDQAWNRADVNGTGMVESSRVPTYLREIVGPGAGFGLQMQKTSKPLGKK